jgi:hypothetical protein
MAAFSLWQLLNQRHLFPGDDPSDPAQQQQASGQAIGQSLSDFWDRAQAGPLDDRVWRPGSLDGASFLQPMPLPNYVGDSANDGDLPLLMPLGGGYPPAASNDPQPDGQPWTAQSRDPNIHSAGLERPAIDFFKYGLPALGAALEALLKGRKSRPQTSSPPPATPDPANRSPNQPPTINDDNAAADTTTTVPAPSVSSASPSAGRTIGDFTVGSESPFEDSDFFDHFEPTTSDEEREFRGDFSRGRHAPFVQFLIDSLRKAGCTVESHVPLGVMNDPRTAIADWMHQCYYKDPPTVGEGKTGLSRELRRNQPFVYEQAAAGNGTSWSPKVRSFGLIPGTQFPPLPVMRSWSPWHGAPIQDDYPFGGAR